MEMINKEMISVDLFKIKLDTRYVSSKTTHISTREIIYCFTNKTFFRMNILSLVLRVSKRR